jgi:hypothetical protein
VCWCKSVNSLCYTVQQHSRRTSAVSLGSLGVMFLYFDL